MLHGFSGLCVIAVIVSRCTAVRNLIQVESSPGYRVIGVEQPTLAISLAKTEFSRSEIEGSPVCGESVPELANSTWAYTARDGSILTYTCDVGFKTESGSTSFDYHCSSSGSTTRPSLPYSCIQVRCPKPQPISNSDMRWTLDRSVSGGFGHVLDYVCDRGYTGDGKARGPKVVKKVCGMSGKYEFVLSTITSCQMIHCAQPLSADNAIASSAVDPHAVVPFGGSVSYGCATGFVVSTNRSLSTYSLSCGEEGEFVPNDPMPRCVEATCPSPPVLDHAATAHIAGSVKIGDRVIYRCVDGYAVSVVPDSSTFNIRCDLIGDVPGYVIPNPEFRCKANLCAAVPSIPDAMPVENRTDWRFNETATFTCAPGYSLGGVKGQTTFTGSCNSVGAWSISSNPICIPTVCGTDEDIPSELLEYTHGSTAVGTPFTFGQSKSVSCLPGAVVTNSGGTRNTVDIQCGPDGEFISSGVCAVPCDPVYRVANSTSRYFGKSLEYGQSAATIQCKPGHQTATGATTQEVTCDRDGNLSPMLPCGPPTSGSGGYSGYGYGESEWQYQDGSAHVLGAGSRIRNAERVLGVSMTLLVVATIAFVL